jgi:SprT-like family
MAKKAARRRSYERKPDQPIAITPVEYSGLQEAYDHFNAALFDGRLVDVFITYQRHARSKGYFAPDRFSGRQLAFGKHELALNPDHFIGRSDEEICSTLVHEMVHCWQQQYGKPGAGRYHNREWAARMKAIGLQPSSTAAVGGKETGQSISHYIIPDRPFTKAFAKLAASGWKLNLQSAHRAGVKRGPNSKTKFTCSACGQNAWGKPDLAIVCEPCGVKMLPADASQSYDIQAA